ALGQCCGLKSDISAGPRSATTISKSRRLASETRHSIVRQKGNVRIRGGVVALTRGLDSQGGTRPPGVPAPLIGRCLKKLRLSFRQPPFAGGTKRGRESWDQQGNFRFVQ